ncbi:MULTISPECIES: N-acetylmuramoyl-L-alanine amidase [unclassified Coleofasciculus]|uniref:N-acetylmuramoyl-L-alanine amidase n=1 Tax=unclassified Coleofasciculus TaxID=2692782 RepID=UPI00187FFB79|nr:MULTISPECIES: N-acetylmuramoyl-L-alanine amidase [unclassified Coleofasciculus]MBE9128767.1 N-acetylmuramoyl-L-alanine amidase [Coleofasciculus sp. LEGE 07081]MBE9151222.1 N-acetylmuramoyl-L-alanine amidase [Coleofasciculus sp. LEGE 07092]
MRSILGLAVLLSVVISPAWAEQPLYLAYPPANHQTTADQIFLIGTAPPAGEVLINGKVIERSPAGHFAPSFSLQLGENRFTLRYQNQDIEINVTRLDTAPEIPTGLTFGKESLTPSVNIAKLPGELLCFSAIAPPNATVSVKLSDRTIPLLPQSQEIQLPPNSAALTARNQPTSQSANGQYKGCATAEVPTNLGQPDYQLTLNGKTITQAAPGTVSILNPANLEVAEVIVDAGVARTGPSTDYSRLTPLPKGTRATITGREGEWVRLDYGAWIKAAEVRLLPSVVPPLSLIRSIRARQVEGATEVVFPLQVPVPVSVQQGDRTFTLTLYNTTAQTDTIYLDDDPLIKRLDWQQVTPTQVQYTFNLKTEQQWGYELRYEGTSLILTLRHPPKVGNGARGSQPLAGIKILLDPGHGGAELGARGPTGYPEKDVNLVVSKLLREQLQARGATVYITREEDQAVSLSDRVKMIDELKPAIALSIHYNALPDGGDAINTKGVSMFWYHPQAHSLSVFLHNYLVDKLGRPSSGVFWNNLALTRPATAPSVLLELGFLINPVEFEWITNPQEQQKLAEAIADGIVEWFQHSR